MVPSRLSRLKAGGLTALTVLQLTACTALPPAQSPPVSRPVPAEEADASGVEAAAEEGAQADRGSQAQASGSARAAGAASRTLLEQSRAEQAAGDYSRAAASLERALRIDPADPWVWLELGRVRLAEGDHAQAETLARRALTLADGDASLEAGAGRLLQAIQGL